MYGVVLWSNSSEDKAVIWCEDHGELAYYRQTERETRVTLDAGDWVQFDVTMERHMRYAHNPRLVAEGLFDGLAQSLVGSEANIAGPARPPCAAAATGGEVICFPVVHDRRRHAAPPAAGPWRPLSV